MHRWEGRWSRLPSAAARPGQSLRTSSPTISGGKYLCTKTIQVNPTESGEKMIMSACRKSQWKGGRRLQARLLRLVPAAQTQPRSYLPNLAESKRIKVNQGCFQKAGGCYRGEDGGGWRIEDGKSDPAEKWSEPNPPSPKLRRVKLHQALSDQKVRGKFPIRDLQFSTEFNPFQPVSTRFNRFQPSF